MLFKSGQIEDTYAYVYSYCRSKLNYGAGCKKNVCIHMAMRNDCQKHIFQYLLNMIAGLYILFTCRTPPQCLVF